MTHLTDRSSEEARWGREGGERGQAMVEYAFVLALVALVCVGTLGLFSAPLNEIFQTVADAM
jgi:Flp pilus assembly pilin Flp